MSAKDLELARQRLAAAQAQFDKANEQLRTAERRADTRKKIILGGALLALQKSEPEAFESIKSALGKSVGSRDRKWLDSVGISLPVSS